MHFAPWVNLTARLQRSEVKNEAQRGNIHNRRLDSSHKQKRASSTCNFIGADMELQSGVLFSPALTQCPHIPLCVCGWPLLTPPKEWPYWLQRVESRTNHQTQSDTVLFACCSSSPAVWALMWESYFDDFFFFFLPQIQSHGRKQHSDHKYSFQTHLRRCVPNGFCLAERLWYFSNWCFQQYVNHWQ